MLIQKTAQSLVLYDDQDPPECFEVGKRTLQILEEVYPAYTWHVMVKPNLVQMRLPDVTRINMGMVLKLTEAQDDWTRFRRAVVMKAGEFLERAGLPRRFMEIKQDARRVEGVAEKWQLTG